MSLGMLVAMSGWVLTAQPEPRVPVLVELFTSEGCSSCPGADAIVAAWTEHPPLSGVEVIPLGFHVDYWDALGWPDRYASPAFTERQSRYGKGGSVYTPQMVVDGTDAFVGTSSDATDRIRQAAAVPKLPLRLVVRPDSDGFVAVEIAEMPAAADAQLWVALTEDGLSSDVARGENAGRTLRHAAVVRTLKNLGSPAGAHRRRIGLPKGARTAQLKIVAWIEAPGTHRVRAAASAPVPR